MNAQKRKQRAKRKSKEVRLAKTNRLLLRADKRQKQRAVDEYVANLTGGK